jgi:hypothetical protein
MRWSYESRLKTLWERFLFPLHSNERDTSFVTLGANVGPLAINFALHMRSS